MVHCIDAVYATVHCLFRVETTVLEQWARSRVETTVLEQWVRSVMNCYVQFILEWWKVLSAMRQVSGGLSRFSHEPCLVISAEVAVLGTVTRFCCGDLLWRISPASPASHDALMVVPARLVH